MEDDASVEVSGIVDGARFGPCALTVSVLTTLALVFDGFDIQAIAFAAPRLMSDWGIDRAALAPILAAGLLGMFVGALVLGIAGDRYGRRRALLASMALMAASSLLAATADGPAPLATYRFLTGLGLGGTLPNATALMVEFTPLAIRTVIVAITVVGVPIGGMIGAAIAARLVPALGWPSIFVLGGVLPGLLLLAMAWLLPESPQYLARRPQRAKELATTLNRVLGEARYDGSERFTNRDLAVGRERVGPLALFGAEHRRETLVIWLIFFTNVFTAYCYFSWTPTVLSAVGLSLATALRGLLLFNLGGVIGALLGAWWMGRAGSRPVLLLRRRRCAEHARHRLGRGHPAGQLRVDGVPADGRCGRERRPGADVHGRRKCLPDAASRHWRRLGGGDVAPRRRVECLCGQRGADTGRRSEAVLHRHCDRDTRNLHRDCAAAAAPAAAALSTSGCGIWTRSGSAIFDKAVTGKYGPSRPQI